MAPNNPTNNLDSSSIGAGIIKPVDKKKKQSRQLMISPDPADHEDSSMMHMATNSNNKNNGKSISNPKNINIPQSNNTTSNPIGNVQNTAMPASNAHVPDDHDFGDDDEFGIQDTLPKSFDSSKVSLDGDISKIKQILNNMILSHGTSMMLAGDPGVGKTTFIKRLSTLIGIPVVIVEAPHVTEEHLINIPFLIFDPESEQMESGGSKVDTKNFEVTLAKSHLATELSRQHPLSDSEYIAKAAKFDNNLKALFKQLGGSSGGVPKKILQVRSKFRVILFLDEYFRQTSGNVRNILRNILNGKIGNDDIPKGTYVVYASNLSDVGGTIENLPLNVDFKKVQFDAPNKDSWFHYVVSQCEKDGIQLKKPLIDAFYNAVNEEDLSHTEEDDKGKIRISPRRWEQLLLYVNNSLPVKTPEEACALLTNVRANFKHMDKTSSLYPKIKKVIRDIIAETSGIEPSLVHELKDHEWKAVLVHQIQTKMRLGDKRAYIPVIQGLPGIGKTSYVRQAAKKFNMRLVSIDCSTLTIEEITGIPIPDKGDGKDKMSVGFSPPALYQKIMNDIASANELYLSEATPEETAKFKKQPYKYLIFFDELNRVKNNNVFNALRRVILEKTFSDDEIKGRDGTTKKIRLPQDSIVIAAMNPNDKNTVELTDHLKDVVDLIDTTPSWSSLENHLKNDVMPNDLSDFSDDAKDVAMEVLNGFVDTFSVKIVSDKHTQENRKFYISWSDTDEQGMYISPREYTTMFQEMVAGIEDAIDENDGIQDVEELVKPVTSELDKAIESTLSWIMDKQDIDSPQFLNSVKDWLEGKTREIILKAFTKKRASASLGGILNGILEDRPNANLKDDGDFINYINNFQLNQFTEDFNNFLVDLIDQKKEKLAMLTAKTHNAKVLLDKKISLTTDTINELTYIVREITTACKVHNLDFTVLEKVWDVINTGVMYIISEQEKEMAIPDDEFNGPLLKASWELHDELDRKGEGEPGVY